MVNPNRAPYKHYYMYCNMYSFLLVGHTKFSPDWCFQLFKQKYRKTKIAKCNFKMELCVFRHMTGACSHFNRVTNIKNVCHFTFVYEHLEKVFIKEYSDRTPFVVQLLKDGWNPKHQDIPPDMWPPEMQPPGLSAECELYLF